MCANVIIKGDVSNGIPKEILEIVNLLAAYNVNSACININVPVEQKNYYITYERDMKMTTEVEE